MRFLTKKKSIDVGGAKVDHSQVRNRIQEKEVDKRRRENIRETTDIGYFKQQTY